MEPVRKYGWKKDPDYVSHPMRLFSIVPHVEKIKKIDLRPKMPPVYDQGNMGSCTANALAAAFQYLQMQNDNGDNFKPSRLFIYFEERKREGTINEDSGATLSSGIQVLTNLGVCPEDSSEKYPENLCWPYKKSNFSVKPPDSCYAFAIFHSSISYRRISQELSQIKQALIDGFPVAFGFSVYRSFESPDVSRTGMLPMPKKHEKAMGGHAVLIVGFDNSIKTEPFGQEGAFIVRNSWGENWGDRGYFYMPYDYVLDPRKSSDFWAITHVV